MDIEVQKAYDALKTMGVPVIDREDEGLFIISAEDNSGDTVWADYYNEFRMSYLDDFGVHKDINKSLTANDMYAEWVNPGFLAVHYL